LNEKLDRDDKRKCHNLTASASHEKAVRHQIGKRLQTKRLLTKPGKTATQVLQNTPKGKCRLTFTGLKGSIFLRKPNP
jgi:phage-related tail protein